MNKNARLTINKEKRSENIFRLCEAKRTIFQNCEKIFEISWSASDASRPFSVPPINTVIGAYYCFQSYM